MYEKTEAQVNVYDSCVFLLVSFVILLEVIALFLFLKQLMTLP